jgi:predicted acylesterase/phospholipase RssA
VAPEADSHAPGDHSPSVALALGAGGARGCAHIGVIRGLERLGLRPIGVAGGSIGALVGALYALGASGDELARLRLGARIREALHLRLSATGFLDPAPLIGLVRDLVNDQTFADARLPLAISAVDLAANQRVVLQEGDLASAVAASMMVPGVFPPLRVADHWLNDPGIVESVPVDAAAAFGAQSVIAVSADRPTARGRLFAGPIVTPLFRGASRMCESVGIRLHWPLATHFGSALICMSQDRPDYATGPSVVWVRPEFGSMNANQFGAWDRAIYLGETALRQAILTSLTLPRTTL